MQLKAPNRKLGKENTGQLSKDWSSCPSSATQGRLSPPDSFSRRNASGAWLCSVTFIRKPACRCLPRLCFRPWCPAREGQGGNWNRSLSDFLCFLFVYILARNLSDWLKRITQLDHFLDKEWRSRRLWHSTGLSNGRRTFPQLSVSPWQKERSSKVYIAYL